MTDRQIEKSNPSMPYDTIACLAGLITIVIIIIVIEITRMPFSQRPTTRLF